MLKNISIINIYNHDFTLLIIEAEVGNFDTEDERNSGHYPCCPLLATPFFP